MSLAVSDNKILNTLLALESQLDKLFASSDPFLPDDDVKFRAAVSDLADRELVITISWAKQVPGRQFLPIYLLSMSSEALGLLNVRGWHDKQQESNRGP